MVDFNESIGCKDQIDKSLMPWKGMEFSYIYNRYAKIRGFGNRQKTSHFSRRMNVMYRKLFVCEKQGTKRTNDSREAGKDVKRR